MSLDSRVAELPYESSSFATPASGALWMFSHVAMSLQESIETYSAPCKGGSPAQPERGWRAQRANLQNAYYATNLQNAYYAI